VTAYDGGPIAPPPQAIRDFRRFFEAEFGYVCRALRRLGVLEGDVYDVTQEVFVTVYQQLSSYDPSRPLRPWLYAFAVRFASNYRRLSRHTEARTGDVDVHGDAPSSERRQARDLVLRALETMDFDQRAVVVMHDFEGMSAPEIAAVTEAPLNTVYSRIRLGREAFRRAVVGLGGVPA
jgi:RNA polymerase sigma-70 factor (ECF subfamily)